MAGWTEPALEADHAVERNERPGKEEAACIFVTSPLSFVISTAQGNL